MKRVNAVATPNKTKNIALLIHLTQKYFSLRSLIIIQWYIRVAKNEFDNKTSINVIIKERLAPEIISMFDAPQNDLFV